ncbi:MAG: aminotransferase class I/II-fold pyridoxal phosphate-dependent enzyme [Acidobacteria bacterium]|nr:aminotransferase class I/II-fold pyridoxal phosphate-dependent enzyme [Acidobacteriota bacterium]NIM60076.1 aminotransferase class I/II-fold pyridoxal phosphate-dependent enzyme [Acidobacteriota bacterium]NIO58544.1 aminotransferase class I/II-fold pyridoxal phosphate-dependent enzyme [Acidobacteriota bacterium]NIQ29593.1 aminotransferase class I/II-fold pyridoxal phosphate-dependent enzyme [Acidobacteriota bacterium]NIQ84294.1 aminotransferase class I/II-fold pyridoxal phosphate-dependent e
MLDQRLRDTDPEIAEALDHEAQRQHHGLELIASENFVSEAVLEAMGSVMTNKYAEGYPGRRYYGGCEVVDVAERLARSRAKELFGAEAANVQPHSGSQANQGVYFTVLEPGDTVLGMDLSHGGHLTHGHPLNLSGILYNIVPYGVRRDDEQIDYEALAKLAAEHKPKMIVCGASAYPRTIDFERIAAIATENGAVTMADIAHIAGLVATGRHPSPVPHCEYVTTTTHKTLRGPRGGLIMTRKKLAKNLNRMVFPGLQGGPFMHIIAAKAVAFKEAQQPEFAEYTDRVIANAAKLAEEMAGHGYRIVSGGTDNHLFLVDVFSKGITGKDGEEALEKAGITVNKNTIPFDENPPMVASGLRIGTPAVTTRGMDTDAMVQVGEFIARGLAARENETELAAIREGVARFAADFPLYPSRQPAQA